MLENEFNKNKMYIKYIYKRKNKDKNKKNIYMKNGRRETHQSLCCALVLKKEKHSFSTSFFIYFSSFILFT